MSDVLPPSAFASERALVAAVSEPVAAIPDPLRTLWNAETCPAALLPWLAWALSVDEWDSAWTEARKRAVIEASLAVHQRKGTVGALKLALGSIGYDLTVREWFEAEPPGPPYTFSAALVIDQEPLPTAVAFDQIIAVANGAKNLRSHMIGVDILGLTRAIEYVAAAAYLGEIVTIAAEPA